MFKGPKISKFGLEIVIPKKPQEQTPILQSINDEDGIEMKSHDGQKIIFINKNSFSITISGKAYKNFEGLKSDISNLNDFFKLCDFSKVSKVAIRKMNVVEFKIASNPSKILEYIISPELLSNLNYFPSSEFIKQNIQAVNYVNDNHRLNLRYGLNVPPPPNKDMGPDNY